MPRTVDRREFLKIAAAVVASQAACAVVPGRRDRSRLLVNDIHSELNPTWVERVVSVRSPDEISDIVRAAGWGDSISIAGSRHAIGGQQFANHSTLIDIRNMNRILSLDRERGLVEAESGIEWPELIDGILALQPDGTRQWGIAQKQTGADKLTLGGSLAANVHGRGLRMKPFISDVESFRMITAEGEEVECSRNHNRELFTLAIGGYGLFGVITSVTLRLTPRRKLRRVVEIKQIDELMPAFEKRIEEGYLYGDCQFSIDEKSDDFLTEGVFSCYQPVDAATSMPAEHKELDEAAWRQLLLLAHTDKAKVYRLYADYYLSTSGQLYWSDTHQLTTYLENYHRELDRQMNARVRATEIITEIYVPRARLPEFMRAAREDFRRNRVNVIYGTIRLIERDDESFLAWAREPYACVIFNLHTEHSAEGTRHSAAAFQRLIDMAIERDGNYYLTYHRYARRDQVERCYPQFARFLDMKRRFDPDERFQSDWYRHYRNMFATG